MTTSAPTPQTRVLVVDDSVVVRQVVARALRAEPGLELAGVAANGRLALDKLGGLHPDVVVLDLDMPEMDGFETLAAIRARDPELPVIVFSHLTERGASSTVKALALGASGFALKPAASDTALGRGPFDDELLQLIKALASPRTPSPATPAPMATAGGPVSAVVVAASTGGPQALATVVTALPADLAVPVLVVQHMPPMFTAMLATRLDGLSPLAVVEGVHGTRVEPGHVYLAPGGHHLAVAGGGGEAVLAVHDGPAENSCRPAADVLFRSAAEHYGSGVLAVVLTGMGSDGLRGAQAVRCAGGTVVVQDPATAVVASMPAAVADAGLAEAVVHLDDVAAEIARRTRVAAP